MAYEKVGVQKTETIETDTKEGQVTEGIYLGAREILFGTDPGTGKKDIRTVVDMKGKDGNDFAFWAATSIKMVLGQIESGTPIRVTYNGWKNNPKTGRRFKAYDVERDTSGRSSLDSIPA